MTLFYELSGQRQLLIAGLLFLAAGSELVLFLYRCVTTDPKKCLGSGACFLLLLSLVAMATAAANDGGERAAIRLPWILFPLLCAAAFAHVASGVLSQYRRQRESLSSASVKQTLDELNSGICFSDRTGQIILINRRMRETAFDLIGGYPRTIGELWEALAQTDGNSRVQRIENEPPLYRFPDGRVRRFYTAELQEPGLRGFIQTMAQDVTELYEVAERLRRENEALRETNEEMRQMYDRLADRIREQETLNLKMRIHDDIGTSLIAISALLQGDADENMDEQLRVLRNAVSYFGGNHPVPADTFEDARRKAAEMNVDLELDGVLPDSGETRELIVSAARECVTNCIRHAEGDRVTLQIRSDAAGCTAVFTNNGVQPDGPIREGGGLSSLRKRVEQAGGEMQLANDPRFALILNLPKKERAK